MAAIKKVNLQDTYLNRLRKDAIPVTAYLMNGVPVKGKIKSFDNFVILLLADGKQNLIYKHAISTILPQTNLNNLFETAETQGGNTDEE